MMTVVAEATMAAQGWSSLPADLVNRVADSLLATNDLDCYTDLRAVCHHWRSATADARSNPHDPRFRPSRWIMLDERKASTIAVHDAGALLFVNTVTGRFLRRSLPLLRDPGHAFITSTTDGLLILAATDPPHAVSVLNPFTGSLLRFAAPLPSEQRLRLRLTADLQVGSPPTLVMVSVGRSLVYGAEPLSEDFYIQTRARHGRYPASRLPQIAAAVVNRNKPVVPAGAAKNIFYQLLLECEQDRDCRCYAVVAAGGDMLAVLMWRRSMDVYKVDSAGNTVERINSIGSQALFLGVRCLAVDTRCFPTVEANCAYFLLDDLSSCCRCIYKFDVGTYGNQEPELVSTADDIGPFTLTQLLCNYTVDILGHELTWEGYYSYLDEGYIENDGDYEDYIDFVDNDESNDVRFIYQLSDTYRLF